MTVIKILPHLPDPLSGVKGQLYCPQKVGDMGT